MSEYIVDDKTCMIRVDSVDKKETSQWKVITDIVTNGGKLPMQKLEEWFVRRKIPADGLTKDQILIAKSIYGMLQITCVATAGNKVGVFFRHDKEGPTGQEKITTGYSIMRSWSPRSTDIKSIQAAFIKKTGFAPGPSFDFEWFGLGYNDLLESSESTGPGYLFVVHKVLCSGGQFPSGEQGATDKKSGEKFIGFFDPETLYAGRASYQDEPIKFKARMDNLILRSLATGERKVNIGDLAAFNQDSWVMGADVRFEECDHPTEQDKKNIITIRRLTEKYGPTFCTNIIYDALKAGVGVTAYIVAKKAGW
jgi:hypothetical protein